MTQISLISNKAVFIPGTDTAPNPSDNGFHKAYENIFSTIGMMMRKELMAVWVITTTTEDSRYDLTTKFGRAGVGITEG